MRPKPLVLFFTLFVTFFATSTLAAATAGKKPDLKLRVSTHHGFLPFQVTLKGELKGVDPADWARCLVRVEWSYTTPGGLDLTSLDELPCLDGEHAAEIPASFEKTLRPKEPGTYLYRIILEPRDGRRLAGTTQEVRVFRAPVELGVKGTRSN